MALTTELNTESWAKAFGIAHIEQISVYDATYLSLAIQNDATFIAADRRLLNQLSQATHELCHML